VLVDAQVIAQGPPRLLVAGMGDALATWFDARTCVAGHVTSGALHDCCRVLLNGKSHF
jgi:glycerol dehydrogenase-like iron-containing ADH family enzyme